MKRSNWRIFLVLPVTVTLLAPIALAGTPAKELPVDLMTNEKPTATPVANAAFIPGPDAGKAPAFNGTLTIAPVTMQASPAVIRPIIRPDLHCKPVGSEECRLMGRDVNMFPGITLGFTTV
ncbi:MAG: hypothetical protein AB7I50_26205, partial [Vicinamibacterales bacterium]